MDPSSPRLDGAPVFDDIQGKPVDSSSVDQNSKSSGGDFSVDDQLKKLEDSINAASMPQDLHDKATAMLNRLKLIKNDTGFFMEYDSIGRYIEWIVNLPWNKNSQDILDLAHARSTLDSTHYGLGEVKEKIEEYLSIMILIISKL